MWKHRLEHNSLSSIDTRNLSLVINDAEYFSRAKTHLDINNYQGFSRPKLFTAGGCHQNSPISSIFGNPSDCNSQEHQQKQGDRNRDCIPKISRLTLECLFPCFVEVSHGSLGGSWFGCFVRFISQDCGIPVSSHASIGSMVLFVSIASV